MGTKVILVGYPGSQHIVKASKYLTAKYLPGFDVFYLNYDGEIKGWSKYLYDYFSKLNDEFVIFALDDYLLSSPLQQDIYKPALHLLKTMPVIATVKMCANTPEEHDEYPVTTQYHIWRRTELLWLLNQTSDPWNFEVYGSELFRRNGKQSILSQKPILDYPTHSCLSARWQGVRLDGLSEEDKKHLTDNLL